MKLIIARHGTVFSTGEVKRQIGSRSDPSLSSEGRRQSEALAAALKAEGFVPDAIYSGPLRRQAETADMLFWAFGGLPVRSVEGLSEIDYGEWEGLTKEELLAAKREEFLGWVSRGEWPASFGGARENFEARIRAWLSHVAETHPADASALAVSSQGTLFILYSIADPKGWARAVRKGGVKELVMRQGHYSELEISPDGSARIKRWNVAP